MVTSIAEACEGTVDLNYILADLKGLSHQVGSVRIPGMSPRKKEVLDETEIIRTPRHGLCRAGVKREHGGFFAHRWCHS